MIVSKLIKKSLYTAATTAVLCALRDRVAVKAAPLTAAEQEQILQLHNQMREAVQPPASNIVPLVWDAGLASVAQSVADRCINQHSHTPNLGENLAWAWPSLQVQGAVDMWNGEKSQFNINGSPIAAGHYTQCVWASTSKLGCAKTDCANLNGSGSGTLIVCEYNPQGNWLNAANLIGAPYEVATQQAAAAKNTESDSNPTSTASATPAADTFSWQGADAAFGTCSVSCGQGVQTRSIQCVNQIGDVVSDENCSSKTKPASSQSCDAGACPVPKTYQWQVGEFSQCSAACEGQQTRSVTCQDNTGTTVGDENCNTDKPAAQQVCNGECPAAAEAADPIQAVNFPLNDSQCDNSTAIDSFVSVLNDSTTVNNCSLALYLLNNTGLSNCSTVLNATFISSFGASISLSACLSGTAADSVSSLSGVARRLNTLSRFHDAVQQSKSLQAESTSTATTAQRSSTGPFVMLLEDGVDATATAASSDTRIRRHQPVVVGLIVMVTMLLQTL